MSALIDKHLIYVMCLLFFIPIGDVYTPVISALVAIILLELTNIFTSERLGITIFIVFVIASILFPSLRFFLPVFLYDMAKTRQWLTYLSLFLFFLDCSYFKEPLEICLWWILIVLSTILALRTKQVQEEHEAYVALRDQSVETEYIMKKKNQELLEKQDYEINVATLTERNRIAREIHDNVGHMLSRCILLLGAIMTIHKDDEELYEQLSQINENLNEAMNNIRESVHDLHDESIDLKHAITMATADVREKFLFRLDYDMSAQVPRNIKYCLIAIVKEAMNNILKHSNGNKVTVMLREHPAFYQLMIEDNGTGAKADLSHGIGLSNMMERAEALGGTLNIQTENGFKIMMSIPKDLAK